MKIQRFTRQIYAGETSPAEPEQALRWLVNKPAIALLFAAFSAWAHVSSYFLEVLATFKEEGGTAALRELDELGWILNVGMVLSVVFAVVIIVAANKMMNLRSYRLAVAAGILAMIPTGPTWIVSGLFGLWALIVLARMDVKAAFKKQNTTPRILPQSTATA